MVGYNTITGKKVLVMGLGVHGGGVSVVQWLVKHGAHVTVTDLKTRKELVSSVKKLLSYSITQFPIRFVLGCHRESDFRRADIIVQNPAVPRESPYLVIARRAGAAIENEATLFFKCCRSKNIIGVTGTRGKSTTSAMIAHILENNVKCQMSNVRCRIWLAGNIRTTPMLSIVDRVRPNDWVVLELSSWHLENMGEQRISPHVAVVTNLLQDHLNRYRSMGAYARAKENIVRYQRDGDIAVLNRENVWTKKMATRTAGRVCWFPIYRGPSSVLQRTVIRKFGAHYVANAHAAAVACHAIGVPIRIIRSSLRTFRGLPDRQESIRVVRGVTYVNDTTATTPDATIAALQRFSTQGTGDRVQRKIVLICGGTDKNLNYKPLIPWIKKTCKAVVLLPGAATEKMKIEIKKFRNDRSGKLRNYFPNFSVSQFPIIETSSMRSAVTVASKHAMRGNIILLSPAAASFGLFQHEFDRGEQFRTIVRRLT